MTSWFIIYTDHGAVTMGNLAKLHLCFTVMTAVITAQVPTFQHDILPVFAQRCLSCHGEVKTANLDMRTLEGLMKGGASGPVIQPGHPDASFLWKKIASDAMPLGGKQLTPEEKELVLSCIS